MIHHHDIGPKPVEFGVTSKDGILNQGRNLSLTEPSRTGFSLIQDCIKSGEQFLMLIKLKFCDLFSGAIGFFDLARN